MVGDQQDRSRARDGSDGSASDQRGRQPSSQQGTGGDRRSAQGKAKPRRSGGEARRSERGRTNRRQDGRGGERRDVGGKQRRQEQSGGERAGGDGPRGSRTNGQRPATADPPTDPDVTGRELDDDVRAELSTLSGGTAGAVARHLVTAGRLLDDDPELAYQHALAARRRAGRVGVVREAAGIAAYNAGRYAEALAELRAARRITGSAEYLPMMADSERGLGRPRRALDLAADPAVTGLDVAGRIEMLIVAAGARRDLGQLEAAVVSLQVPELRSDSRAPWVARLRYGYADALAALGRLAEARAWFVRAAEADEERQTDALERIEELDNA
jgi:hypothetical protein